VRPLLQTAFQSAADGKDHNTTFMSSTIIWVCFSS